VKASIAVERRLGAADREPQNLLVTRHEEGEVAMASSLIKLTTLKNMAPGQAISTHWNNAAPERANWQIQAVPLQSSFTDFESSLQSVDVEVTRVWRRLNRIGVHSDVQPWRFECEIHYTVKNVGTREVDVDIFASIIS
jgi:hypothetical protein